MVSPAVEPLLNKSALKKLGWTPALIEAVLGRPDREQSKRVRAGYTIKEHIYTRDHVIEGMRDQRFIAAAEKRKRLAETILEKRAEIPKRYATWREALPGACAGMFSLNRYAKYDRCSELSRHEIYRLKNDLVELLYGSGYCQLAWIHRLQLAQQNCHYCAGEGTCGHCDGSGIWRQAKTVEFWCFRFQIGERFYTWHQPRESVRFTPAEAVPPQDWDGIAGEKPLPMPPRRFADAKRLISWVIEQYHNEQAAAQSGPQDLIPAVQPDPAKPSPPPSLQDSLPF